MTVGSLGVTEHLRRDVWDGMIGADMRYRYFDRLAARAKTTDDTLHVLLFIASGTTAAGVLGLFSFGATVLAVASAILAAVTATLHFGQRASKFAEFSVFWGRIHADYKRLWDDIEAHAVTQAVVVERLGHCRSGRRASTGRRARPAPAGRFCWSASTKRRPWRPRDDRPSFRRSSRHTGIGRDHGFRHDDAHPAHSAAAETASAPAATPGTPDAYSPIRRLTESTVPAPWIPPTREEEGNRDASLRHDNHRRGGAASVPSGRAPSADRRRSRGPAPRSADAASGRDPGRRGA